jgi:hypothetical protein
MVWCRGILKNSVLIQLLDPTTASAPATKKWQADDLQGDNDDFSIDENEETEVNSDSNHM